MSTTFVIIVWRNDPKCKYIFMSPQVNSAPPGQWWRQNSAYGKERTSDFTNRQTLQWRHNESDGVSNPWRIDCLLNHLLRRRSKKTPKLRVTGFCVGIHRGPVNSRTKGLYCDAENVSIWWRHHEDWMVLKHIASPKKVHDLLRHIS